MVSCQILLGSKGDKLSFVDLLFISMLRCPNYTEKNPLNPEFQPIPFPRVPEGAPLKIRVCLMLLVSSTEQSPQCCKAPPPP